MNRQVELGPVARESVAGAFSVFPKTLPWLALLVVGMAGVELFEDYYQFTDKSPLIYLPLSLALMLLFNCIWGASIYRLLLRPPDSAGLAVGTSRLFAANLLVYFVFGLLAFMAVILLAITSGILVVASGYDPSGGEASDINGSVAALRQSGAIWLVYMAIAATIGLLAWFALRLFLYGTATIGQGRIMVFRSWSMTKGAAIRISILVLGLVGVPLIIAGLVNELIGQALGLASFWSQQTGLLSETSATPMPAGFLASALGRLAQAITHVPAILFGHSLAAAVYRRLGPHQVDAEAVYE